ncbi:tRNA (guanine(37)-N(1))-methyltransferase [Facklamia sp. HMSC062C11]|uniref:tRNA (guanine-N(1)-)-methyltransferase n=1 Tax=Facklamia hominis TaxID=178214 RepID=A0AAJ1Q3U8_9LACT|nr:MULTISPECIES: tRNA (guanosine(37)-N1)-methyltransferase TrmD [Facklamia]MDK7187147.1 tRNA (guanosine(37)-N1)-methyltransferase TrmD [Facklamia hominis]OFL65093.1 tRNA (guanine(37)-N(1))-methyltransferase [Facklamia sp. HMSC062C11]
MKIDILTLFPQMFSPLNESVMKLGQEKGLFEIATHDFRQFAVDKHGHVDDYPYGGGAGMLLRVEPIVHTLESLNLAENCPIILIDPTGQPFDQKMAESWSKEDQLVFICGHYEGFDERVRSFVTQEVSLGDFVLTNGEIPAMVMIDATVRLIPEVVGNAESIVHESFQQDRLEYPQYTRPAQFRDMKVPDVLLSGHHKNIERWRSKQSFFKTLERRSDLIDQEQLTDEEKGWLKEYNGINLT